MLINKITPGFVIQVFDTELKRFVSQSYTAGDDCQYEDKDGEPADSKVLNGACLPFDMVQPKADTAAVVNRLATKAESAGLEPEDLDDAVHDLASGFAADVNNDGVEEQLAYLVEGLGVKDTERQLDELIKERAKRPKEGE